MLRPGRESVDTPMRSAASYRRIACSVGKRAIHAKCSGGVDFNGRWCCGNVSMSTDVVNDSWGNLNSIQLVHSRNSGTGSVAVRHEIQLG